MKTIIRINEHDMRELKNSFLAWYNKHKNFLSQPLPSKTWDQRVTDSQFQAEVTGSHTAQAFYAHTEAKIARDYAKLFDTQLRKAFGGLTKNDLENPVGFSNIEKASPGLKKYFECRNILEHFISQDICEHTHRESQLHAFRRWISITEVLLNDHNYEGACLVLLRLSQIDTDLKLSKELPSYSQKILDTLNNLIYPSRNFAALRNHMLLNKNHKNLPPTFLLSKDMTFFNEVLGEDKDLKIESLTPDHPSYDNLVRKASLLEALFPKEKPRLYKLPQYLEHTFDTMSVSYHVEQSRHHDEELKNIENTAKPQCDSTITNCSPQIQPTNLYTQKLLPTLWNRRLIDQHKYWENTLATPKPLPFSI